MAKAGLIALAALVGILAISNVFTYVSLQNQKEKLNEILGLFPLISLDYTPTKIVNNKVYDIKVKVNVISPFYKLEACEVKLIPCEYEHFITKYGVTREDYRKIFPPEETRTVSFKPRGVEREVFSANFTDLKGGREYIIVASAKDSAGNVREEKIKTPYIREFENIAPLDDFLVGAYYYPWYSPHRHWREGYKGSPLLGEYDSRDPIVISKHIDWATGHGIDFFMISWWGPDSFEDRVIKDYFLKNSLIDDIKFAILYESLGRLRATGDGDINIDLNDPANKEVLLTDFNYLASAYFNNPHYLKIGRYVVKYVVELHLARVFKGEAVTIKSLREEMRNKWYELCLIGDLVYWQDPMSETERIKLYDAVTSYSMHTNVPGILNDFENNLAQKYNQWFSVTKNLKVGFIPSASPGFDDSAVRSGNLPLQKSTERLKKQVEIAKLYMDKNLKMILITTFNEWHEYTYIEPSFEDGYKYLQAFKEQLYLIPF